MGGQQGTGSEAGAGMAMAGPDALPIQAQAQAPVQADAARLLRLPSGAALHAAGAAPRGRLRLLFLHGVGGGAWSWAPQVQALAPDFDCRVWEGRGHGQARPAADAGLADFAQDAHEALQALWAEAPEPVLLVAHSMGGMLALDLARRWPQRVCGLCLVDPVYAERGTPPAVLAPLLALLKWAAAPLVRSYQADGPASRWVSRRMFARAFHDRQAMERAWPLQRQQVPLEPPRMLNEAFTGVQGFEFRPFADELTTPLCLLEARPRPGARSRFAAVAARWQARGVPCTHLQIDGGHYLQWDRPAAVTAALQGFAQALAAGQALRPAA